MNLDELQYKASGAGDTQCERILDALKQWPAGEWCPMPHLARAASDGGEGTGICVSRRIYDLRRALRDKGFEIRNEKFFQDGQYHSFYKIVRLESQPQP